MRALARQRRQIQRQRGGERLAFARLHLDDRAVEHGDAAEDLHVEVPHVERAPARLADQGKGLRQHPLERLVAANPIAQRQAALAQIVLVQLLAARPRTRRPSATAQPSAILRCIMRSEIARTPKLNRSLIDKARISEMQNE